MRNTKISLQPDVMQYLDENRDSQSTLEGRSDLQRR